MSMIANKKSTTAKVFLLNCGTTISIIHPYFLTLYYYSDLSLTTLTI